jgi:ribosome-associated protein
MDRDLVIHQRLAIPAAELQWRFTRSSGPGGQNVNKLETAVELLFDLQAPARALGLQAEWWGVAGGCR